MTKTWKSTFAILVGLVYAVLPFIYWKWLVYELESGTFPTKADSIGIPMAGFLFAWFAGLLLFPIVLILVSKLTAVWLVK